MGGNYARGLAQELFSIIRLFAPVKQQEKYNNGARKGHILYVAYIYDPILP